MSHYFHHQHHDQKSENRDHCHRSLKPTGYAVDQLNQLAVFDVDHPEVLISLTPIVGLQTSENIVGIALRPSNNTLYAVGSTSRLYILGLNGVVAPINTVPFSPALSGAYFGVSTDPVGDQLRVVSDTGINYLIDFGTAAVTSQTNLSTGNIVAAAYTNSVVGATATNLFTLDSSLNMLNLQSPASSGVQINFAAIQPSAHVSVSSQSGFSIRGSDNAGYVVFQNNANQSVLYRLDLLTGNTSQIGIIGDISLIVTFALANLDSSLRPPLPAPVCV